MNSGIPVGNKKFYCDNTPIRMGVDSELQQDIFSKFVIYSY